MHKIFELASAQTLLRGIDYYETQKVIKIIEIENGVYSGLVQGSSYDGHDAPIYHVSINTTRPRKSICDCPFAKGRYVICKHMIALFIEAEPEQLDRLYDEQTTSRREELEIQASDMRRDYLERAFVEKSIWLEEFQEELEELE